MLERWWGTHKDNFDGWREYKRMMRVWFDPPKVRFKEKYDGRNDLHDQLAKWTNTYGVELQSEWMHLFCHTLDIIPMNWYLETQLCHGTDEWYIFR